MDAVLEFDYVLTNNKALGETWAWFDAPTVVHSTMDSEGYGRSQSLHIRTLFIDCPWRCRTERA
jgi:hypothetical protein